MDTASPPLRTLRAAWGDRLDGPLLASPVVAGNLVVAATENDTVYGLDVGSGCIAWSNHLGSPVDGNLPNAGGSRCTPFPKIGITSTPVIDVAAQLIYVSAFLAPGRNVIHALDLATGATRLQREIDRPGTDPLSQLTRAALTIAGGRVYAAFGGRAGDCGNYHGYVVGLALDLAGEPDVYTVPSRRQGGIWSPAGLTLLAGGDLLVATGNGDSTTEFDGGNSVVRLTPRLQQVDFFAPSNWAELNRRDFDLGSVGPTIVDRGRVFQIGKEGIGYLLDANHLGEIGGQLRSVSLGGCYAIGGTAYQAPYVYVPCDHGMKAVDLSGGNLKVAWKGPDFRSGSPVIAGGAIWNLDFEGGYLWAFKPDGHVIVRSQVGTAQHFVSPATSNGRLFLPVGPYLLAYAWS